MHLIQKAVLLLAIILVCYFDGRYRIIPNKLIAAIMAIGLATNVIISGWQGLVFSAAGFSAGLLILIIPFLLGGIGAGDVKLLAAIGCLLALLLPPPPSCTGRLSEGYGRLSSCLSKRACSNP